MKWKETEDGTTRIITGFLWFPKFIDGETRWLVFAKYEQRYMRCVSLSAKGFWEDLGWIDE